MRRSTILISIFAITGMMCQPLLAQSYSSERVGNPENLDVEPDFALCLMGGRTENDQAITWWLEHANGGDVLVLRASGGFAYNSYFFEDIDVELNSVETIIFNSAEASQDPYVIQRINEAEAIWMAGGNQADYVNFWQDTPVMDGINALLNDKQGAVGGTSAGMAVMGQVYFPALAGSATSASALSNPLSNQMTLGYGDFLQTPFLENTVTETHLNDPARLRYGRVTGFLARLWHDQGVRPLGIGANEYCAVTIDDTGVARAWGDYPEFGDDFIYFLQANCTAPFEPEILESNQPLTWNRGQQAVKVFRAEATPLGTSTFDLNDWNTASGGVWEDWYVEEGELGRSDGAEAPSCFLSVRNDEALRWKAFPNPASDYILVDTELDAFSYVIYDVSGKELTRGRSEQPSMRIPTAALESGIYLLRIGNRDQYRALTFVKYQ